MIRKRDKLKGVDGYTVFSIRIKDSTLTQLNEIAVTTNRSRNEVINILLEQSINNCVISDEIEQYT